MSPEHIDPAHQLLKSDTTRLSFSVVIPTHNGRASVRQAVESILHQTWPFFEVVVVADGDIDKTHATLAPITDPRLIVLQQVAGGVGRARNLGIQETTSPWITFLDDDDVARPHLLATWAANIGSDIVALTAAISYRSPDQGQSIRQCRLRPEDGTLGASKILAGGFAVRRDVLAAIGGYDPDLRFAENQDLGLRICDYVARSQAGAVVQLSEVVTDVHVEKATSRIERYGASRGAAALTILSRHEKRLAQEPTRGADLYRILAWSAGHAGDFRGARAAAFRAFQLEPRNPQNWRAVLLYAVPGASRMVRSLRSIRSDN